MKKKLVIDDKQNKLRDEKGKLKDQHCVENEYMLRLITESAFDFIWTLDMNMNLTFASDSVYKLLGYTREEVLGLNVRNLYSPGQFQKIQNIVVKELAKGNPHEGVTFTATHLREDGSTFQAEVKGKIIYNDKDEPVLMQGYTRDITQELESQRRLKLSEERYRKLFDYSPIPIVIHDGKTIVDVNPATLQALGFRSKTDMIGMDPLLMTHPDDFELAKQRMDTMMTNNKPLQPTEFRLVTQNKTEHTVLASPVPIDIDGKNLFMVYYYDITKRKHAETTQRVLYNISNAAIKSRNLNELLNLIQKELGEVIDSTNFFVALYNNEDDTLSLPFISDEKDGQTSFPAGKTLTKYVIKTQQPLLVNKEKMKELVKTGEVESIGPVSEIWLGVPLKAGDEVTGVIAVQSYTDEHAYNESDMKLLEFIADHINFAIERKRADEKIVKALEKAEEGDRLKSAFLANMSHEIRTPMNGILGFTELLKDPALTSDELKKYIGIIETSGDRMLNTINDIIDISKIEAGQVDLVISMTVINELNRGIWSFFILEVEKKGLELIVTNTLSDKESSIMTDKDKLEAILVNLIKNSIKYSDKGKIEFGYYSEGDLIKYFVRDTGIGIPKGKQEAIFDRFVQADITQTRLYEGSGLGLSIVKGYIELLKGKIWLESEPGKGSVFFFTIPKVRTSA